MAAQSAPQLGRFHLKCSRNVHLSEDGKNAWIKYGFGIVFSKEPIPRGRQFSVKVLEPGAFPSFSSSVAQAPFLGIGVTTKGPHSGPVLQRLDDFTLSEQHWYVKIDRHGYTTEYKGQQGRFPWELDSSKGKTAGCWVSEKGDFHLCSEEPYIDDVMGKRLPTDRPLWGFVVLQGPWKVEANYEVAMPKGHPEAPAVQLHPKAPAGHPQDYAGKTFHFVESPPERLICAICQELAHDPVQANCCGKIYCVQCIKTWKKKSNSCPTCRSTEQSDPCFNVFGDRNAHQSITSLTVYCPCRKEGCSKTMELSEVENHLTSDNCFLFQRVECEYKRFGCAVVLPRKDVAEHLKTSVQNHLQMTKRRVEEQEVQLKNVEGRAEREHQAMRKNMKEQELLLQEEKAERQRMEVRLKNVEERAEREGQRMNEVIALRKEWMKDRAEEQAARLQESTERQLMKEKMHKMNTLMGWLLIYLPILLVVFMLISYHQGLLPPIITIILSYVLCLFSIIHSRVLYM